MKIRVLLYKAKLDGKLTDNVIAAWTQLIHCWRILTKQARVALTGYSHAEIWVPNKITPFWWEPDICKWQGTSYTSTMGQIRSRGTIIQNGTCKRPAVRVLIHPERWDYVEIDVNEAEYHEMLRYLDDQVLNNAGYGKADIAKFFGLGFITDKKRNICSEIVHNALIEGDVLEGKHMVVSPLLLAVKLVKAGHVIKKLQ